MCLGIEIALQGRVTSFYGPELQKYTSIRAHPENEGPVKQFLFHERGIISVAPKSVHLSSRRGLTQWHIAYGHLSPGVVDKPSLMLIPAC